MSRVTPFTFVIRFLQDCARIGPHYSHLPPPTQQCHAYTLLLLLLQVGTLACTPEESRQMFRRGAHHWQKQCAMENHLSLRDRPFARNSCSFGPVHYKLKSTLQSIIIGKGLRETAPMGRGKQRREIRVLISSNYARLNISETT